MSLWTYINGTIIVSPMGRTQAEKRYVLETVLNHLPIVTGSERDMQIYIVQKNGHNSSSSCDEYGERTNNLVDRYGNKNTQHGWLEVQNQYILVVNGGLRDRVFNETYKEFMKWICRLAKRITLDNILVQIEGYDKQIIINDNCNIDSPYYKMYEWPSWCVDSNGEPNWCEHLLWDRMKDCSYPMLLGYKYFDDVENDNEVERRRNYYKNNRKD